MKTRIGFVSNSSSTSFLIAVPKDLKEVKCSIKVETDLLSLSRDIAKSDEELLDTIYHYYDDEELENDSEYAECQELINDGYNIVEITVSDDDYDDRIGGFLCYEGLDNFVFDDARVKVIRGDGGY